MKNYLRALAAMALLAIICNKATADGIEFNHGNWEQVKAVAKAQHKRIFVDFYTTWCGPCKMMAADIFPLKKVGDFYNKNFICVEIDAEKGEGVVLAKKYNVHAYPTMIFVDDKEDVIYRTVGGLSEEEFLGQGKIALAGPSNELTDLRARYEKNELNKDELYKYFLLIKAAGDYKQTNEVFNKYFALAASVSAEMFNTITSNVESPDSKAFVYLEQHHDEFAKIAGKEKVDNYIKNTYLAHLKYDKFISEDEFNKVLNESKARFNLSEKDELDIETNHYCDTKDKARYMPAAIKLANDYLQNDDFGLSNLIGGATRHFDLNNDEWLTVKSWAERALAIKDNALNNASLAMVYKGMKKKEQALKYINKALEDSQRDHDTFGVTIGILKGQIENATY